MKRILFSILLIGSVAGVQAQDLKLPSLSPTTKVTQEFSTSSIEISYSRPSLRGRKAFGDVVAFNHPWRTGANGPTKIKTGEDLYIGGQFVKAGEYVLYSIPSEDKWEIILNKGTSPMGPNGYDKANDVARFVIPAKKAAQMVQTFTIDIENMTFNSCDIVLSWEKTSITIPVEARNEQRLDASIDKAINNPNIPYFQAANYYYETNQHLDKANMYVDKALQDNPNAYFMWYLKARIEKKMGHKAEAIAAAKKSIETAKGSALENEYIHNNQKIINDLQ
jgi:tetratricopeptide (TPR) repeat protein